MESRFVRGSGWGRCAALAALTAVAAAGCVGATATGSASLLPAAGPTETASAYASAPASSSPIVWATEAASPTATPTTAPTASPNAVVDPLTSVPPAPSGTWKSIHWTALPASPASAVGSPSPADSPAVTSTFQVFGWSRGYVGFTISTSESTVDQSTGQIVYPEPTAVSSYSIDGVHWHTGQKLNLVAAGSQGLQVIRSVIEGPAGLLAVGWSGGCGSEYLDSLWTSSDGISWHPVDVGKVFGVVGTAITHVSGGAAGYVAVAYKSAGAWTSKDGRSWRRVPLNSGPFKNSLVDDGTAISGGFVLAGTTGTRDCGVTISDGSTPAPIFRTASAWWSADSSTWTRISLPGAVASSEYRDTWVCRLSDRATLVVDDVSGTGRSAWASKDGRTWTAVSFPEDIGMRDVVSAGQHNLVVNPTGDASTIGGLRLRTVDDGFAVVSIDESGDVPQLVYSNGGMGTYGLVALGPTGAVVTNADGSQLWFGTPSAQ